MHFTNSVGSSTIYIIREAINTGVDKNILLLRNVCNNKLGSYFLFTFTNAIPTLLKCNVYFGNNSVIFNGANTIPNDFEICSISFTGPIQYIKMKILLFKLEEIILEPKSR